MLDHILLYVSDLERSKAFYDQALAAIGMQVVLGSTDEEFYGYGKPGGLAFEIAQGGGEEYPIAKRQHVAFRVVDKSSVDAFHRAALAAGGTDNGAPGPRPHYGPTYYAAFVRDLDGNNIEAMTDVT